MDNKFLLPIFLASVVLVSGCTSATITTTTTVPATTIGATTTTTAAGATVTGATITQASVKEFSITASQWKFEPGIITVKQGDAVKLVLTSIDVTHGLSIPAFNVNKQIAPGSTVNAEFVADKKGTFPFVCSVFCGSGHGSMTGKLVVQ